MVKKFVVKKFDITDKFEMDCAIIRALQSADMHNWFVVGNNYHMSGSDKQKRYDWINLQGDDYRKKIECYNLGFYKRESEIKEKAIRVIRNKKVKGKKLSIGDKIAGLFAGMGLEELGWKDSRFSSQ